MNRLAIVLSAALLAGTGAAPGQAVSRVTPVVRVVQKARPAVVNISSEKIITTRWGMFGRDIFEDIFPSPFRRQVPVQSLGSGFLIHPAGYIVTNAHVIRRAQKVTVTLADKTRLPARIISADPAHDLAVLKVDPPGGRPLPHLVPGRSDDLMVGETVVAIGNPLGYADSVTSGIISAVNRTLEFEEGVRYEGLIQTDTPINPGNSGGPLLNILGELIGINTAIRPDAQNIGFAVSVDTFTKELPNLLDFERINRVVFGAKVLQRNTPAGPEVYVAEVRKGTPADGRLRVGDRVVELNGRPVRYISDFTCEMLSAKGGTMAKLKCRREGRDVPVAVAVQPRPRPDGRLLAQRLFGMTLREITPQLARDLRLPMDAGLMVAGIDADGPADRIGLRLKDVIFQVGRLYVKDLESLGMILEDVRPGEKVRIGVARGTVAVWVLLPARSRPPAAPAGGRPAPPRRGSAI